LEYTKSHFDELISKEISGVKFKVYKDKNIKSVVSNEVVNKSLSSLIESCRLGNLILGETELPYGEISMKIMSSGDEVHSSLDIPFDFVENSSVETISAALLHEMVEGWREDHKYGGEGVQQMVEFLFCGDNDGRESYFKKLGELGKDTKYLAEEHVKGWKWICEDFDRLIEFKRSLNEDQKIDYIKQKLLNLPEPR